MSGRILLVAALTPIAFALLAACQIVGEDCGPPPNLEPNAQLQNCDLTDAPFVVGVPGTGANVTSADFTNSDLNGAQLVGAQNSPNGGAPFIATDANFTNANLTDTELVGFFDNANFTEANLTDASLFGNRMENANFTNANLTGADFTLNILTGAVFSDTTCPDGTIGNSAVECGLDDPLLLNTL